MDVLFYFNFLMADLWLILNKGTHSLLFMFFSFSASSLFFLSMHSLYFNFCSFLFPYFVLSHYPIFFLIQKNLEFSLGS